MADESSQQGYWVRSICDQFVAEYRALASTVVQQED
jgi:hypothetical protein